MQLTRSVTMLELGNTNGLNDRLRGHIGVSTNADNDGWTMGPPADREYAVEPVGVLIIRPSDCYEGVVSFITVNERYKDSRQPL